MDIVGDDHLARPGRVVKAPEVSAAEYPGPELDVSLDVGQAEVHPGQATHQAQAEGREQAQPLPLSQSVVKELK